MRSEQATRPELVVGDMNSIVSGRVSTACLATESSVPSELSTSSAGLAPGRVVDGHRGAHPLAGSKPERLGRWQRTMLIPGRIRMLVVVAARNGPAGGRVWVVGVEGQRHDLDGHRQVDGLVDRNIDRCGDECIAVCHEESTIGGACTTDTARTAAFGRTASCVPYSWVSVSPLIGSCVHTPTATFRSIAAGPNE